MCIITIKFFVRFSSLFVICVYKSELLGKNFKLEEWCKGRAVKLNFLVFKKNKKKFLTAA